MRVPESVTRYLFLGALLSASWLPMCSSDDDAKTSGDSSGDGGAQSGGGGGAGAAGEGAVGGPGSRGGGNGVGGGAGQETGGSAGESGGSAGQAGGPENGPVCGDGTVAAPERCDDSNTRPDDGCDATCRLEDGWICDGASPTVCAADCGDGKLVAPERTAGRCDDGNFVRGDGCDAQCGVERGWVCVGEPSQCAETCGNGAIEAGEECDDDNPVAGDGCHACVVEDGFRCNDSEPSICGDIDECDEEIDDCHEDATCTNTGGSFACACKSGFAGNGRMCTPVAVDLDVGSLHSCALLGSGSVRCWGLGESGRLGYGNTQAIGNDEFPASAGDVNVGGAVEQIRTGADHTCALLRSGDVRCWGRASSGQLGYGNTRDMGGSSDRLPFTAGNVDVAGVVRQLDAGQFFTCALLATGAVRCWGMAGSGQLGYGNTTTIGDNETPATAGDVNVGGTVRQIAVGVSHACAVLTTGAVRCWGYGPSGELGYGNTTTVGDDETPASAGDVNVGGSVEQIAVGDLHTCARLTTGAVRCWGYAGSGRLGYGNANHIGDNETPASAGDVFVGGSVQRIAAGGSHTCAVLTTGAVRCWGDGTYGKLGYGNANHIGDNETPASAGDIDLGGPARAVAVGAEHMCALLTSGAVRCWGHGGDGRLGYGDITTIGDNEVPASAGDVPLL